jgi:hypothetical protein
MNRIPMKLLRLFPMYLFFACGGFARAEMSAADLYKEALYLETTSRDLEAAAGYYEKVGARADAAPDLKAKALVRLGQCRALRGETAQAKTAWTQVIEGYPDQTESVREARMQLQELALKEPPVERVVVSSPVIQVVYELKPTKWEWEFARIQVDRPFGGNNPSADYDVLGGNFLLSSLAYFYKPNRAFGMQGGWLGEFDSGVTDLKVDQAAEFFGPFWRAEKALWPAFRPYFKTGVGAYYLHSQFYSSPSVKSEEDYWTGGLMGEVGFTIGLSKGFALNFGYNGHMFLKKTPTGNQGGGQRGLHGPLFSMSYRW